MDKTRLLEYFARVDARLTAADVAQAVERLPAGFRNDVLVRENLRNLREDLKLWSGEP